MSVTRPAADPTFLDFERVHEQLDEMFLEHQEALVARRFQRAITILEAYERALRIHVRHEDRWLLPIYEQRRCHATPRPKVAASVFSAEHQRMLQILGEICAAVHGFAQADAPPPRDVIRLLDAQCTFKRLVEHHNTREHNILYPCLDQVTSLGERHGSIERCIKESAACHNDHDE
ncbi:MAG: hemerythrin domain-containing protein [Phycisphaeraceae bacterium]|nr:hemerythrin domain-containing protein [Phycisphaeraceae bacterium]